MYYAHPEELVITDLVGPTLETMYCCVICMPKMGVQCRETWSYNFAAFSPFAWLTENGTTRPKCVAVAKHRCGSRHSKFSSPSPNSAGAVHTSTVASCRPSFTKRPEK